MQIFHQLTRADAARRRLLQESTPIAARRGSPRISLLGFLDQPMQLAGVHEPQLIPLLHITRRPPGGSELSRRDCRTHFITVLICRSGHNIAGG